MIRIPYRPMLAGAFALFCAACGGSSRDDEARALLQVDSAFSTPVTIRIPRSIRVTASRANAGDGGFSGIARFGPEHFHRLNAPMNVLSAAGVLRVSDHSQRMLVRTLRFGGTGACVPYPYHPAPGFHGPPTCRVSEQRIYDYSHRVQVSPTGALGAEWREDTEPWEPSFGLAGAEFSPGWVVELGRREIVDVGEVRNPEIGALEVDYTWRWALTPTGAHFDPDGATQRSLPSSMRTFAIARMAEAPRSDTVYKATALLLRIDGAWKMSDVRFK